ncbi:predicted protein [Sclerotinia sclerotiorum 1980 UF-70]|uniref:Uncharacterized protein n=1 Tax=Sclerotinia sclerotiorum (strain ATCC 18683 / 1980 / Ss-1) TaxID=665079 RepID=A7FA32_SCLS1|nr:predicted protein [Sclerotinia sclerotiorum 1980 UF-70]EDO00593.1 predicted protein [Sclerotinia sclerotiorum 1980 UF-70]
MTLSAFCESTSAETVHALRILKAEFQALECTPVFANGISNNNVDDGDSDTYSVTSNSSATTDFSTFTTLTEEGFITCNTYLCESCAQSITNHIHETTRADQEYAIAATRVSHSCDLNGRSDMVPLGLWLGNCICLSTIVTVF